MTNNKQQTAVEWFYDEMIKFIKLRSKYSTDREIFKQAREMEKERIIKANRDGVDMVVDKKDFISGEQYYEQTYGGGNK
jgi:uncharacterized protein with FMN-binding domain